MTCRVSWPSSPACSGCAARYREVVNFSQSIADLPTMFQRPGLNVTVARADDVPGIVALVPGLLRLRGPISGGGQLQPVDCRPADHVPKARAERDGRPGR